MKRLFIILVVLSLAVQTLSTLFININVNAVASQDWQAGKIIDDTVFTDTSTMTANDIQLFLKTKLPECDIHGEKQSGYGGGTRAQYAASRDYSVPFTCLTGYYEVPKTAPGPNEPINNYGKYNSDGSPFRPSGSLSASEIIYNAAKKYSISPRALIVKLATESPGPLTSDDWPFKKQYLYAMGAHCPDSGPNSTANCDANYSGFSLQMDEAAKLLRWYLDNMNQPWWTYKKPFQTNNILWNVAESNCGAADVYLESKATAALYTYTPYQPNQAALNNMYGEGDGCSAYGNRNFWRVWRDWFGSTNGRRADDLYDFQRRISSVVHNNYTFTFYYDLYQHALRMRKVNADGQVVESVILDGKGGENGRVFGDVGSSIGAINFNGAIQLYYYDSTNGTLRHAWSDDGDSWNFEHLDGSVNSISKVLNNVGVNPSVISYEGMLQIFYYDRSNGNLRRAWNDSKGWHFENLDGDKGSIAGHSADVGLDSSLVKTSSSLQLFYYDRTNGNLRHGWRDKKGWHFENLDGDKGSIAGHSADVGVNTAGAFYANNSIQLFYYDRTNGNLRHGWTNSSHGWRFENLDGTTKSPGSSNADAGINPSVVTVNNSIQLFYYDRTNGNLRHGWTNSSHGWRFENLDGDKGSIGRNNGLIGTNSSITYNPLGGAITVHYLDHSYGYMRSTVHRENNGWRFSATPEKVVY